MYGASSLFFAVFGATFSNGVHLLSCLHRKKGAEQEKVSLGMQDRPEVAQIGTHEASFGRRCTSRCRLTMLEEIVEVTCKVSEDGSSKGRSENATHEGNLCG